MDALLILFLNLCKELQNFSKTPLELDSLIKRFKAYYKDKPDVNLYKMAYEPMPSQAAFCSNAKQQYTNEYFCYADKFALLINRLGIVRYIPFRMMELRPPIPKCPRKRSLTP